MTFKFKLGMNKKFYELKVSFFLSLSNFRMKENLSDFFRTGNISLYILVSHLLLIEVENQLSLRTTINFCERNRLKLLVVIHYKGIPNVE